MLYLITRPHDIPRIEEHAADPFPLRDTLVSIGYETREQLLWSEGLTMCVDCQGRIWAKFSCEAELKAAQICNTCRIRRTFRRRAA